METLNTQKYVCLLKGKSLLESWFDFCSHFQEGAKGKQGRIQLQTTWQFRKQQEGTMFLFWLDLDALMEHFLEGITPLRHWCVNPNEKRGVNKYKYYSLLS